MLYSSGLVFLVIIMYTLVILIIDCKICNTYSQNILTAQEHSCYTECIIYYTDYANSLNKLDQSDKKEQNVKKKKKKKRKKKIYRQCNQAAYSQ